MERPPSGERFTGSTILWFRQDLRLDDNPALIKALKRDRAVVPVFIWAPEEEGDWPPGGASKWWLHRSLEALEAELRAAGSRLILRRGPTMAVLRELVAATGARAVLWNHRYEPAIAARDAEVERVLRSEGMEVETFNAALLHEPHSILNKSGKPFQVFTPYWRHCLSLAEPLEPSPAPKHIPAPRRWPASLSLAAFGLEPLPDWGGGGGLREEWVPGSAGARRRLAGFARKSFSKYSEARDFPGEAGTSRLSPHLHFGEISPRQVWHRLKAMAASETEFCLSRFAAELGWREFSHYLLWHFPHTTNRPLRREFESFGWREAPQLLAAWQRGRTGYPLVDAGMRELWTTGWMHNRVRMVVASFLVKDLMIAWQEGARWFWDTLVDADLAQNTLGWQWTAGCGADAAPFFRIFNPVAQGRKFDPAGQYVRRWVPELAGLPNEWIHQPLAAPAPVLARAGIRPGKDYPEPMIQHAIAREVALERYARLKPKVP